MAHLAAGAFRSDYLETGRPVVVEGGARDWEAVRRWDLDHLSRTLGGRRVKLARSAGDVFGYDPDAAGFETQEVPFERAVDLVRDAPAGLRYYLMQQSIPREFPELLSDIPALDFVGGARVSPHLWLGTARNVSPLHYDMANNLFAQVVGRKAFLLFPPEDAEHLRPYPADARHHNLSHVDPETDAFPELARTRPAACEVGPGDLLFLPAFWWHRVRSLDTGVSVSVWWSPLPGQFLVPRGRAMLRALFARDRLLSLRGVVDEHGSYLGVARFLLDRGERGLAALLAAAALEERLRALYQRLGPQAEPGALRDAPRMIAALVETRALSAEDGQAAAGWCAVAARSLASEAADADEAAAMLRGVAAFVDRGLPRSPRPGPDDGLPPGGARREATRGASPVRPPSRKRKS